MVNKLILGTVQFGLPYGINNLGSIPSEKEVFKILESAYSSGVKKLDTAAAYGMAEKRIGHFHNINPPFQVITKFSKEPNLPWKTSLEESLTKLNIPLVETAMFHSFKSFSIYRDKMNELSEISQGNLFQKLGISVYTNDELEALLEVDEISVIQIPFNLLDNENHRGSILRKLHSSGKEIHTRSCFLQGLFFREPSGIPEKLTPLRKYIIEIQRIARNNELHIGHLALQYVLNKNYIHGVLFGVESLNQLNQNLAWAQKNINDEILAKIDIINVEAKNLLNPSEW